MKISWHRFLMLLLAQCWVMPAWGADPAEALSARTDVWGERAIAQPNGPSYEFFATLLPPLRYVGTAFHEYPIVLSSPLGPQVKARLVSDGSAVNANAGDNGWFVYPIAITFRVNEEVFGSDPSRTGGPRFERGYLPIVQNHYRVADATVAEEVFVPAKGAFAEKSAAFCKFSADHPVAFVAELTGAGPFKLDGKVIADAQGHGLIWLGDGWTFDAKTARLSMTLHTGRDAVLAVFSQPMTQVPNSDFTDATYEEHRKACADEWESWVARCMKLETPEERVNRAWKSMVIGTLMIAVGDTMYYSAGNVYQAVYEAECADPTRALLCFGLSDVAKRFTGPLLRYEYPGLDTHNAAFKLQLLAEVYWKTRDMAFVRRDRALWQPAVDRLVKNRRRPNGLEPKEVYCGDIRTPVDSLNANANAWRALRDMAAVMRDIGETEEGKSVAATAEELKAATLAALDASEDRKVTPPFSPIALFGGEKPYETLTASKMGSYWDLMIPYVLGSEILDEQRSAGAIDYLQAHGGVCMGMVRFHGHSGLYANHDGVDDLYSLRYARALLRSDQADRALVSFYGKLAQGLTRETFIGAEGTGLVPETPLGRPMYLPPNAGGNGFFLSLLRELLVQDDLNGAGEPDALRLLFATPRAWLADGSTIRLEGAPTAFGPLSVVARSDLSHSRVRVQFTPPARKPKTIKLRLRLPRGWTISAAKLNGVALPLVLDGCTFDFSSINRSSEVEVSVRGR